MNTNSQNGRKTFSKYNNDQTASFALHQDSTGCSRSPGITVKQAARAIVTTVQQLLFVDVTFWWQVLAKRREPSGKRATVLEKKLPIVTQRDATRLVHVHMDCKTLEEFQALIG
jgi:hypothetical protein